MEVLGLAKPRNPKPIYPIIKRIEGRRLGAQAPGLY
jgi:hypothetical protein